MGRLRIVGGEARGRLLEAPPGQGTRPTSDRVRQALFDVLGQRLDGGDALDAFAGSGALGLEALSRGADRAVFVEADRRTAAIVRANVASLGWEARAELYAEPFARALPRLAPRRFRWVFLDPPYDPGPGEVLLALSDLARLTADAVVVAEHARRSPLPERVGGLARFDLREFGDTALSLFAPAATPERG